MALLLALLLCFSLSACVSLSEPATNDDDDDEKEEKKEKETLSHEDEVLEILEAAFLLDYGESAYGNCIFCEESIDEDAFICDECMETSVCMDCEADLKHGEYIMCDSCLEQIEAFIDADEVYEEEDDIYGDTADWEEEEEEVVWDDESDWDDDTDYEYTTCQMCGDYLVGDEYIYCDDCWESDTCYYCDGYLSDDEIMYHDDCLYDYYGF